MFIEIDALTYPYCGGNRRLIALLTDGQVVRKILAHLGLETEAPRLAPAPGLPIPRVMRFYVLSPKSRSISGSVSMAAVSAWAGMDSGTALHVG